jgi:hypothetical protein
MTTIPFFKTNFREEEEEEEIENEKAFFFSNVI